MIVLDASVWVSGLVSEDVNHRTSRKWLENSAARAEKHVVPVLLTVEVAGAIARRTGSTDLARRALQQVLRFPLLRLIPVGQRLSKEAARLAAQLGLRGADAVYVATAYLLTLSLITWDQDQMVRSAQIITVSTPNLAS